MNEDEGGGLIRAHFEELTSKYSGFAIEAGSGSGGTTIKGILRFSASAEHEGIPETLQGEYKIEIILPPDYPDTPPAAKEIGGKIDKDFHTYSNGNLCLGAPIAVRRSFAERPNLIGFVETCVIPYLYSYEYNKKHGILPFGELSHGDQGIIDHYRSIFSLDNNLAILGFLKILADNNYRGHLNCPCGSGQRLRSCHGFQLIEIMSFQNQSDFIMDYVMVMGGILRSGHPIPKALLSKMVEKKVDISKLEKNGALI